MVSSRSVDSLIASIRHDRNVKEVLRSGSNISVLLYRPLDYGDTFSLVRRYFPQAVAYESHFEYRTNSRRKTYTIQAYNPVRSN